MEFFAVVPIADQLAWLWFSLDEEYADSHLVVFSSLDAS